MVQLLEIHKKEIENIFLLHLTKKQHLLICQDNTILVKTLYMMLKVKIIY